MKTKKILFGALSATVIMFLSGWLIYGVALSGYMEAHSNAAVARPMEQMSFAAMVLSNFVWALLLSIMIDWSGKNSIAGGAKVGATIGFLANLGFSLSMYATTTLYSGRMLMVVDTIAFTVLATLAGAGAGWAMQKASAQKTAVA